MTNEKGKHRVRIKMNPNIKNYYVMQNGKVIAIYTNFFDAMEHYTYNKPIKNTSKAFKFMEILGNLN